MKLPVLTNSKMACYKQCPRKAMFSYHQRIRMLDEKPYFSVGRACHAVIEACDSGVSFLTDSLASIKSLDPFDMAMVRAMMAAYFEVYGFRSDLVQAEQQFRVPLLHPTRQEPHPDFEFAGKIDRVLREGIGETKTVSSRTDISPASDYWKKIGLDPQISGYLYAARTLGFDVPLNVEYDVLRKPDIKPSSKPVLDEAGVPIVLDSLGNRAKNKNGEWRKIGGEGYTPVVRGEEPAEFEERCYNELMDSLDAYFVRVNIPRLEVDIHEWQRDAWTIACRYSEDMHNGTWVRNTSACTGFGRCDYLDHCRNGFDVYDLPRGFVAVESEHQELENE